MGRWIYCEGWLQGDLPCGAALGGIYRVGQLWGNLLCGAALEGICVGNFGGIYYVGQLWGASVWATLGPSTVWVDSDQLNTMCFKEASLKQEKEGKSGPQTP